MKMFLTWWKNGGTDTSKAVVGWCMLAAMLGLVAYGAKRFLTLDPEVWEVFITSKWAQAFVVLSVPTVVLIILECVTEGFTIKKILSLTCDSTSGDKIAAAILLVGLALVAVLAVQGTSF